jgi:hypothetical protein
MTRQRGSLRWRVPASPSSIVFRALGEGLQQPQQELVASLLAVVSLIREHSILTLPTWHPPTKIPPSPAHLGESDKDALHLAVGRALNEWELVESILALIFGLLVESRSSAARHAYGTLIGGTAVSAQPTG